MAETALRLDSFQTRPGIKPFPFSGAYMRGGDLASPHGLLLRPPSADTYDGYPDEVCASEVHLTLC